MCDTGTVLWSVSKPTLDPRIIRENLAAVHRRGFFPLFLPTGVKMRDMEKVWHKLQFNPAAPVDVPFKAELFRPAPRGVQVLRQLARKGQSYLDRAAREQGGRDKLVLGLPNDAREMAPLLAYAHGDPGSGPLSAPSVSEGGSRSVGSTTATSLPAEPQNLEGTGDPVTSAADQEQGWAGREAVSATVNVGEQADQVSRTVPPSGTNAGSNGDFVSDLAVAHLEEMLSEDLVRDSAGGQSQMTAARHIHSRSGAAERTSKSLQLIKDLKRGLRDADKIG